MNEKKEFGQWGEDTALQYFIRLGAKLIQKNFQNRGGEIDLIIFYEDNLIFVEVRTRKNEDFMNPIDSIDLKKQKKIKRTAQYYYSYKWKQDSICRFDVISIIGSKENYKIEHIEDAFI
ncbi:MAG: YraN family protein [Candidatus Cloacimonadota bacterium]|nr:MAG: YraN family protein [Candidatus Cloacimonadota bacterium]